MERGRERDGDREGGRERDGEREGEREVGRERERDVIGRWRLEGECNQHSFLNASINITNQVNGRVNSPPSLTGNVILPLLPCESYD